MKRRKETCGLISRKTSWQINMLDHGAISHRNWWKPVGAFWKNLHQTIAKQRKESYTSGKQSVFPHLQRLPSPIQPTRKALCRSFYNLVLSSLQQLCSHLTPATVQGNQAPISVLPAVSSGPCQSAKCETKTKKNYLLHFKMTDLIHSVEIADICHVLNWGRLAGLVFWDINILLTTDVSLKL